MKLYQLLVRITRLSVGRMDMKTEEILVEIGRKLGGNWSQSCCEKLLTILSYTIALCNDRAEVQGVLSYPPLLSYSPWYLLRGMILSHLAFCGTLLT